MQKARLARLLRQYFNNTISGADCMELLDYLNSANPGELDELIDSELAVLDEGPHFRGKQSQDVLNRIKSDLRFTNTVTPEEENQPSVIRFYQRRWVQLAAAALIFFIAGIMVLNKPQTPATDNQVVNNEKPAKIVPGSNKAILTISGGKTIVLDSAANGIIAKTGAGKVVKTGSGQITYQGVALADNAKPSEVAYNTLTTPRGGQYQVTLPDGTQVWLDAASSITYPVVFTGNARRVKMTGQAYFEVAKNKEKPFYVDANNVEVKVLGTHFNVSAYQEDGQNTTTLLEGSVQISKNNSVAMLKPGQQAVIANGADNIKVGDANIDDVMAWKKGYFIFDDDNISGIMRKVSRWYDVEVDYKGNFDDQHFGGTFYRSKSITELLQHFEKVGKLHFKVSGRRITVMD